MINRTRFAVTVFMSAALACLAISCTKKTSDTDNTIRAVLRANIKGLDPLRAQDLYSNTVMGQIYEGLLAFHYLKRPLTVVPSLAEKMPEVSKDGLTWTFRIKPGVKFQDNPAFPGGKGRELTAEDFVYSFKRLADPRNTAEGFWIFDGKIVGLNEWGSAVKAEKANYDTPIEGLKATDKNTLVIKLTGPYYQLPYVLTMPYAYVVPREAVEKYGAEFLNNPVGTGPFMLSKPTDWVRNSKITLVKNPTWRGDTYPTEGEAGDKEKGLLADAGKPLPFAEKIEYSELIEDQPRFQNLVKGSFDWALIPKDNLPGTLDLATKTLKPEYANKGLNLTLNPNLDVTYVGFNMLDPVLGKNKLLRQAMSLAHDSATFNQKFYNGMAVLAQGPVPPGMVSYDGGFKNPYQKADIEEAKKLLIKAGFPEGKGLPEFQYEGLSDTTSRQISEYFVQQMTKIGIKVKPNANTFPELQSKIKKKKAQIFGIAWGADYPDPQNFFQLFYSRNAAEGGSNDTNFNNADFDKAYEAALKLPDGPERTALYQKMRDIVVEESPWIFNGHRTEAIVNHKWVKNFKYSDVIPDTAKYIRIDAKERAENKAKL